jgi:hypothetical protein
MTLAAVLAITKVVAALAFLGVLIAIAAAYRLLGQRLEAERAEAVIEAEFARLEAEREAAEPPPPARTGPDDGGRFA